MPLSIEAYREISNSGVSQLALLSEGRRQTIIGKASDANVGFLQRLFNTESSKKVNIAITNDFKAALSRAYGTRVADEAFDAVIGTAGLTGAKLSSTLVSKTLTMADKIVAKRLEPPAITATTPGTLRASDVSIETMRPCATGEATIFVPASAGRFVKAVIGVAAPAEGE